MDMIDNNGRFETTIRSTIFDRARQLVIDTDHLSFDDQERASAPPSRFGKDTIEAVRYGVKPIRGYQFRIGRIYCIDVRDKGGNIIKIRLKSIYRVRVKLLEAKYLAIIKALYQGHFNDIATRYWIQFQQEGGVDLSGVHLNSYGVLYDPKIGRASWECLGIKYYWEYFALFSSETPDHYRTFVYLEQWNTAVLLGLIETIRAEMFPEWYPAGKS